MLINKIITHPAKADGEAHFDEVLAVAFFLTKYPRSFLPQVFRKNPTPEELADPTVVCIDVGKDYNPDLKNFDHHQNSDLDSSFVLVARYFGYETYCETFFPWWKTMNLLDAKGPYEAAQALNISSSALAALQTPTNEFLINKTLVKDEEMPVPVVELLWELGNSLLGVIGVLLKDLEIIENESRFVTIKDLKVLLLEQVISGQALGFYRRTHQFDISVSKNARNNALAAYRYEDVKDKIDFQITMNHPNVQFVHLNGFLLITKEHATLDDMIELINLSIK